MVHLKEKNQLLFWSVSLTESYIFLKKKWEKMENRWDILNKTLHILISYEINLTSMRNWSESWEQIIVYLREFS